MSATGLRIRFYGDPALRKKAGVVDKITQGHRDTLSKMAQLMYEGSGIGLAAPQVGVSEAMIVLDIGSGLYKLINPKIVKREGAQAQEEGCLSVPGVCLKVPRSRRVVVEAMDEFAHPQRIEAEELLACVLQHEIDHLKGKLIVDYVSFFGKLKVKKRLRELRKKVRDERLPEKDTKSCKLQL